MKKLLVICGSTASGKTKLGINLAKKFNGEIVSADSRQVYKGMDIGTGKDVENLKFKVKNEKLQFKIQKGLKQKIVVGIYQSKCVYIWGLDLVKPNQEFSVAHFVLFAKMVIQDIWKRNKLPIVIGGTGFWIKALIDGAETIGVPPDWNLREKLNNLTIKQLSKELQRLDNFRWQRMNQSDRNNPRRLIRAIEIAKTQNSSVSWRIKAQNYNLKLKIDHLLMIGLKTKEYKTLYKRIDKRVEKRVKQGMEKEVKLLIGEGYPWNLASFSATGYRIWQDYFVGLKTVEETVQCWQYDEHGLARRQLTFFKKDRRINWFDINNESYIKEIEIIVRQWYSGDC